MTPLRAMAIVSCALHVPLALAVWTMLFRRWPQRPLALWVTGSIALGVGGSLLVARGDVPDWASHQLGNALLSASPMLRIAALRIDLGRPPRGGILLAAFALDVGSYLASLHGMGPTGIVLLGHTSLLLWTLALAWHGASMGRAFRSRAGWTLAGVEALFAAALLLRIVGIATGSAEAAPVSEGWDFAVLVVCAFVAALYGNLGYLGLVQDRMSVASAASHDAQFAAAMRRDAAEARAAELGDLLGQRDRMAEERERLLHILAHELRQPLHTAKGALEAALRSLAPAANRDVASTAPVESPVPCAADDRGTAALRIERAQAVLGQMHSVLDNTLAAAKLLAGDLPLERQDTDIDLLIGLALGDLSSAERAQVRIVRHADCASVSCVPTLVRLALRNLLRNAFQHGGEGVAVEVRVDEREEPPTVLLSVCDDGPGLPAAVLRALAAEPPVDAPRRPGAGDGLASSGLGLSVARRVASVHGGRLRLVPRVPHGLQACLELPDPMGEP